MYYGLKLFVSLKISIITNNNSFKQANLAKATQMHTQQTSSRDLSSVGKIPVVHNEINRNCWIVEY